MSARALASHEMEIQSEDDVFLVRRKVRGIAEERRFDPFSTAALTTATSELSRNILVHGHGGKVVIEEMLSDERLGVRVRFEDQGPGIADVERVLEGGYSTMKSLGLGLSGSRRLVDEFELDTRVGQGTTITITKWRRTL